MHGNSFTPAPLTHTANIRHCTQHKIVEIKSTALVSAVDLLALDTHLAKGDTPL